MSLEFFIHSCIEFGPLTLFFILSFFSDFYVAALGLVIATLIALVGSIMRYRRFALFTFFTSVFILICGTATVYFHDPRWIVIEYTLSNTIFACALLIGWWHNKPVLRNLFDHMFLISDRGWMILTFRWGVLFLVTAITNQLFWEMYPNESSWALFRFVSTIGAFIFGISQFAVSRRERLPDSSPWGLRTGYLEAK